MGRGRNSAKKSTTSVPRASLAERDAFAGMMLNAGAWGPEQIPLPVIMRLVIGGVGHRAVEGRIEQNFPPEVVTTLHAEDVQLPVRLRDEAGPTHEEGDAAPQPVVIANAPPTLRDENAGMVEDDLEVGDDWDVVDDPNVRHEIAADADDEWTVVDNSNATTAPQGAQGTLAGAVLHDGSATS